MALKTKKPAAGGGAAGFPKRTEQRLGGGVPLFRQTPLGRRSGPSEIEALREEVHRFDENQNTHSRRTLNRLCCSAAMRKTHSITLTNGFSSTVPRGSQTQKRPRHLRASCHSGWAGKSRLASDRLARNAVDVGAIDTEVLQFARAHAAKFSNGLTILAPVIERACYVHDDPLS